MRIPHSAKEIIDQLTIDLPSKLGRRVTIPEVIAAMAATCREPDLVRYLRGSVGGHTAPTGGYIVGG